MRILHTADWHLGHRFHNHLQDQEQQLFLDWLLKLIEEEKIDVLLVSGDVFDTGSPSTQSQKMYYDFLIELHQSCCEVAVITGGNHDSPSTLNAPQQVLDALSIKVVGKGSSELDNEVIPLEINGEEAIIAAVPYLRDQDIRLALQGEKVDQIEEKYKKALINHYQEVVELSKAKRSNDNVPIIGMGHLFAVGGKVSDSEQDIYIGTLGHIGADDFSTDYNYIALGHLHKPQIVGGKKHIRYSGSPVVLSFSELGYDKEVLILDVQSSSNINVESVCIPSFRVIKSIKGNREECLEQINSVSTNEFKLEPWIEIILNEQNDGSGYRDLDDAATDKGVRIMKKSMSEKHQIIGDDHLIISEKAVDELTPKEVFKMKYNHFGGNDSEFDKFNGMFSEIVQSINEEE